jgi:hypothetical protein
MTDVRFDRLSNVALRDAWRHEAQSFTPWLAQNIDHIAEAVGRQLELTGTEVPVGSFSADILARNLQDDSVVLIENQLETTDHTHLGQIMTYLAGLEAKTVIWIAPSFREPHLSAIRWLNQHTADGFAFFALRLRVVRIGDSPYAPIFEVVEKPNNWDISVRNVVQAVEGDLGGRRTAFWEEYLARHRDASTRGVRVTQNSNMWLQAVPAGTRVCMWITPQSCGVYIRGALRVEIGQVVAQLRAHEAELARRLSAPFHDSDSSWLLVSKLEVGLADQSRWPEMIDWLEDRSKLYLATLSDLFGSAQ